MDKQNKLDNLKREIVEFKNYSEKLRESMIDVMGDNYHPLPFFGNANAKYMFIGVAPGRLDKKYKNPSEDDSAFKYGSGKILMRLLKDFNIDLELIFFTNIIKSNTPKDNMFLDSDVREFSKILLKEIEILEPEKIIVLGSQARGYFKDYICSL